MVGQQACCHIRFRPASVPGGLPLWVVAVPVTRSEKSPGRPEAAACSLDPGPPILISRNGDHGAPDEPLRPLGRHSLRPPVRTGGRSIRSCGQHSHVQPPAIGVRQPVTADPAAAPSSSSRRRTGGRDHPHRVRVPVLCASPTVVQSTPSRGGRPHSDHGGAPVPPSWRPARIRTGYRWGARGPGSRRSPGTWTVQDDAAPYRRRAHRGSAVRRCGPFRPAPSRLPRVHKTAAERADVGPDTRARHGGRGMSLVAVGLSHDRTHGRPGAGRRRSR